MVFALSFRMKESLRMSEVTIATRSCDSAQPIRMQVYFELIQLSYIVILIVNPIYDVNIISIGKQKIKLILNAIEL